MTTDDPREATGLENYFGGVDQAHPGSSTDAVVSEPLSSREMKGSTDADSASVVRSAEHLAVHTVTEAAERVRLRKYILSEDVTTTVTVRREAVRLERVPLTDADGDVASDQELSEVDYELVLLGERVVVTKEIVPVERIRLSKTVRTEEQQVNATVRSEQVEVNRTET